MAAATAISANAADAKLTGTVIGSTYSVDYRTGQKSTTVNTAADAFDGNLSTYFASYDRSYTWAGLDLGEKHVITRVGWSPRNDGLGPGRMVFGMFQGANSPDFLDAVPIYMITEKGTIGVTDYADVDCSRGFRYVRYVGPSDARCNIAEIEFYGHKAAGDDSRLYRITNLPTVCINTVNAKEPYDKEHNIISQIIVLSEENGEQYVLDAPGESRLRGNASMQFPKKPYRIKFDKKQRILPDAPAKVKKWTLINNYGDKTLMRNLVAFDIARMMGMDYVPFCTPVDVILNGEYRGCYQLADSKEVDKNRVNIHEMTLEEALAGGEALTGGYFLEVDAYANEEPAGTWFTTPQGIPVTVKAPDDKDVLFQTSAPLDYITDYYSDMTRRVSDGKFTGQGNYREILDVESFLQLLMTNEIGGNKDVMWSFNMYKDLGDPHIYSGPAWDFDVAFDNSRYIDNQAYDNDSYLYLNTPSAAAGFREFTEKVMSDPQTAEELRHLWGAVRDNGLSYDYLAGQIDYYASLMDESQQLNFERWPILNTPVHDNAAARGSFQAEVNHIKDFCRKIISHFDSKIGYDPGEHAEMIEPEVNDDLSEFRLSVPYGKLMLVDEVVAPGQPTPAKTAAISGGFINADKEWTLDKSSLEADHIITVYARHAGRNSEVQSYRVNSDGTISGVETITATTDDNLPKEYYNLTGSRVNPSETAPGVYLCRQGDKVTKVILR